MGIWEAAKHEAAEIHPELEKGSEDTLQLNTEDILEEQAIGIDLPAILRQPGSEF